MSAALFAFDLYDKDSSGVIDSAEVKLMLKEIYGPNYAQNVHATRWIDDCVVSSSLTQA
jgi:Ca2+-binding EF-hand superfamily protein